MIKTEGFQNIKSLKVSLEAFLTDEIKQIKVSESLLKDYVKEELPEILKTGGLAFRDKKTLEWKKYREYQVPNGRHLGIWSGETYYALTKMKSTKNVGINIITDPGYAEYGYERDDGCEKYINFNPVYTNEFIEKQTEKYEKRVREAVAKKINRIENAEYNEKVIKND